jgi:hypothetical protein
LYIEAGKTLRPLSGYFLIRVISESRIGEHWRARWMVSAGFKKGTTKRFLPKQAYASMM